MVWVVNYAGSKKIPNNRRYNFQRLSQKVAETGKRVSAKLRRKQRQAFGKQGHAHHGGRNWRALRASTIREKGHDTILVRTGSMRRRQRFKGTFRLVGKRIEWHFEGSNSAKYSHFHQFGFTHSKSGLWVAPRPPIVITKEDKKVIQRAVKGLIPKPSRGKRRGKRR
jgi:phage gpG-like protein